MPALAPRYFAPRYFTPRYFSTGAVPAAEIVLISDAVAAALAGSTLSQTFAVERAYVPVHEVDDLTGLSLTVVPAGLTATLLDRSGRHMYDYVIDLGIQQKQPPTPPAFDPRMYITQQCVDLLRGRPLAGYPAAFCIGVANDPIFSPAHADELRVFTSVVSLTFRVLR